MELFHSNHTIFVYIAFLGSVAVPVVRARKSLILCLRDCASYPSLGLCALAVLLFQLDFSSSFYLRLLQSGFFCLRKGCGAEFRPVKTAYEYVEVSVL